ncbi:MAG: EAL domain-containing protein [Gemmatimonadaceae bacterium]|nr:EAL domain-containing protein [Gemmatimonadaceae bacterium]
MTAPHPVPDAPPAASSATAPELHPLLLRQMKRICKDASVSCARATPDTMRVLLARVSKAYADFDRELYLLERSQEISSREMLTLHAKLRASEARHASLVSLSSDWVWEIDAEGRLMYITAPSESRDFDFSPYLGQRMRVDELPAVAGSDHAEHRARLIAKQPFRNFAFGLSRPDGQPLYLRASGEPFFVEGRFAGYRGVASDVTKASLDAQAVNQLARFDSLTGLPNRSKFLSQLEERIAHHADAPHQLAVMFIDLDRFKVVNDTLGHAAGDQLLRIVAGRLQHALRDLDIVARFAGDEFVVLIDTCGDRHVVPQIAQRLLDQIHRPVPLSGKTVHVSGSIGIALFPEDGSDADTLLKHADAAMYVSKSSGKNTWRFFTPELAARRQATYTVEEELRTALDRDELRLLYQPLFDCLSGACSSVESLIRWQHPERGLLSPAAFLSVAEDTGLIEQIGQWVIRTATQQVRAWRDAGLHMPYCSVNLSLKQFASETLVQDVRDALTLAGIGGSSLEVEITESQLMADPERVQGILKELRGMGVRVAIDDFGTGYSSLAYLKRLSAGTLKVDRTFVSGLPDDKEDIAILRAVLALGHSVGMEVVAEGVETESQLAMLKGMGCDRVQGYLLGKPQSAASIAERLTTSTVCETAS